MSENKKEETRIILEKEGVSRDVAEKIVEDGYECCQDGNTICLLDTFYGRYISLDRLLKNVDRLRPIRTVVVHSLEDAEKAVSSEFGKLNKELEITYRGVNKEYFLNHPKGRNFRNPETPYIDGKEPSLLPSYWRKYDSIENRCLEDALFLSLLGEEVVNAGVDQHALVLRNMERLGRHTVSDLEDDDDSLSQEYYRRWKTRSSWGAEGESATIAQHYGLKSTGLDITYELKVALFFASYKYVVKENGKSTYHLNINPEAAVYCLLFDDFPKKENQFGSTELFEHASPERPKRQKCNLYFVNSREKNIAANSIVYRLKLADDFDVEGLPRAEELFPSRQEDKFYDLLLQIKEKHKKDDLRINPFESIVEYEF